MVNDVKPIPTFEIGDKQVSWWPDQRTAYSSCVLYVTQTL